MRLFRRRREATPPPAQSWARSSPKYCAGCKRRALRYVYMENNKDYCVPCARRALWRLGIRPAGRRKDDITDLDLVPSTEREARDRELALRQVNRDS